MHLPPTFTTVTPLSKVLAMILFIILPFGGFLLGMNYRNDQITATISQDDPYSPSLSDSFIDAWPTPTLPGQEPSDWKIYTDTERGFEFRYPDDWKIEGYGEHSIIQLQQIQNGEVRSIVGSITIIDKANPTHDDATRLTMYTSRSTCPTVAGENTGGGTTNVYCLTGKELRTIDGVWKGAVECSATSFYGLNEDPQNCPHQFWIDAKDFFFIVHFNFFEPIKKQSDDEVLFDRFLSGFRFHD